MTDKPPEESKDPRSEDEGPGSESTPHRNDSSAHPDAENIDDIDNLLASATEALEKVDHQLGEEETQVEPAPAETHQVKQDNSVDPSTAQENGSVLSPAEGTMEVDDVLAEMEKEISTLNEQVESVTEEESVAVPEDSASSHPKQENVSESVLEADSISPDSEENVTEAARSSEGAMPDMESDTAAEETETAEEEKPSNETQVAVEETEAIEEAETTEEAEAAVETESQASPPDSLETPESSGDQQQGKASIDDVLSAMAEELGGEPDEGEPVEDTGSNEKPPEITPEDTQTADEEVDSVLADLEQEVEEADDVEEGSAAEEVAKPEAQAKPLSEDEQIIADEIAAKEEGTGDKVDDPSVSKPNYDHFPPPARLFLQSTNGVNKPFFFVPDSAKDTLGLVAVITLIVSIIAAVVILLCS